MRVKIRGRVMSNDNASLYRHFGYRDVCCPGDVTEAIKNCPPGEALIFEVNSPGGSVYAGFEMYTEVKKHRGETVAEVGSIAGSAASVFAVGCKTVRMSPIANMMIHRASTYAEGNSAVMGQTGQMLDTIDESILGAYETKTAGKTKREELLSMMQEETFLTAKAAVERGLADEVMTFEEEPELPDVAVADLGDGWGFEKLPPVEDLRRRMMERGEGSGEGKREPTNLAGEPKREKVTDITPGEGGEYQEKQVRSEGNVDEDEKIESVEQLEKAYPELVAQLCRTAAEEAAEAERERLLGIDEVAMAGFEDIVAAAKADPSQNAGTVAMAIVAQQKKDGQSFLEKVKKDAVETNKVPAAAAPETDGEENTVAEAKAAVDEYYGKEGK